MSRKTLPDFQWLAGRINPQSPSYTSLFFSYFFKFKNDSKEKFRWKRFSIFNTNEDGLEKKNRPLFFGSPSIVLRPSKSWSGYDSMRHYFGAHVLELPLSDGYAPKVLMAPAASYRTVSVPFRILILVAMPRARALAAFGCTNSLSPPSSIANTRCFYESPSVDDSNGPSRGPSRTRTTELLVMEQETGG